jgi:hypothetical protein
MPIDAVETVTDGLSTLSEKQGIQIATAAITPTEPGLMAMPSKYRARIRILGHDQPGGNGIGMTFIRLWDLLRA